MGNRASKGRQPLPRIVKTYKAWIRAEESFKEVKLELDRMIAVPDELRKTHRGIEVMDVVTQRIEINQELNKLIAELGRMVRIEDPTPSQLDQMNEKKKNRSNLYDLLNELPELGATRKEWTEIPDEFKVKRLGRPRASIELRFVRVQQALEQAAKAVKEEEQINGVPSLTLPQAIEKYGGGKQRAGRPSMTVLDKLDAEIKRMLLLLEAAQDELQNNTVIERNTFGRPSMSAQQKVESYQARLANLKKDMLVAESKLGNVGMIDRDLKSKRQKLRSLAKTSADAATIKSLETEVEEIAKYREFVKKADSGVSARKPYSLDYDRMIEFNKRYIVDNSNNRYIMD